MYWPFLILLAAVVLLIMEAFVPSGGVLGVMSATAFVAAICAAFAYGGLKLGTAFMAVTALVIPVLIYALIKVWPMTPFGKRILIQPPESSQVLPQLHRDRQQLVGQHGVAISPLLPAGAIRIGGRTLDAISDGMTIEKGTPVEIIAVRNNSLVVRPATAPHQAASADAAQAGPLNAVIPDPFDDSLS
jgi:membrane-bound serine protease (ClpP class)